MKKALVVDWLDKYGGAERVIAALEKIFDFDEVHSLVNVMQHDDLKNIFPKSKPIFTSKLQFAGKYFRAFFFLLHKTIAKVKISSDVKLIISSSHAIAKGVKKTSVNQIHITYFQARNFKYIWDEVDLYFGRFKILLKPLINILRKIDYQQAQHPDFIIANSKFVQNWIKNVYKRDSVVIYPPVSLENFKLNVIKDDYYVAVGRIVPYKRFDLIVKAFNDNNKKLIVVGDGSELSRLKAMAKSNITFTGYLNTIEVNNLISKAKAFIHIGLEDFGIAPIEAQSCGTPVIAYKAGGVLETVIENESGVFFNEQTPESLNNCIAMFEKLQWNYENIHQHAQQFSEESFQKNIEQFVALHVK